MKKLFTILLAGFMIFALTACLDEKALQNQDNGIENEETNNEETNNEEISESNMQSEYVPEIEVSKTYKLFKEVLSGPYTMKFESYNKDYENPDNKTVSTTTLMVVDGENAYTHISSRVGETDVSIETLVIGEYQYSVYHDLKMIMRSKVRKDDRGITTFMEEEEFYMDVQGQPETVVVYGEEFYCERFSGFTESIGYCYDGDELKYILSDEGGVTFITGVLEIKSGADSSYFELPEDYDKTWE